MGLFDSRKKEKSAEKAKVAELNTEANSALVPGVGRMPYPAYRGREPYIFVSYSHLDSAKVFAEIKEFNERGYNVWYDEGISPGNEWTDEIAIALENCALFVVFFTPNSAISSNVQNEIDFALDDKKACIAIHLEETVLRGGVKLRFGTKQAILKHNMTQEEYVYKYTSAFERAGIKMKQPTAPLAQASAPCGERHDPPAQSAPTQKDFQQEITEAGDFLIEHGLLKEYKGTAPNIKLPDEAQIIGRSSFGDGRRFIETVKLNKTGALLDGAFENCPNLREVRIPRSVTMIQKRPFINCPKLVVYGYRDHLPEDFAAGFGGKGIVYLDET